ncbi:menin isoform X2 [Episyrphus balteatus]|uniref:menin isoform X2 n=1 Tax=Episyrphus balteatus TaxID=286459 RepID=UPI0024867200|nr:menin isoform X2 [Episyrphus balteatus]
MSSGRFQPCINKKFFPLKSMTDVVDFFQKCLENPPGDGEPDLTLLSIVTGFVEISLTTGKAAESAVTENSGASPGDPADEESSTFPVVTYEMVNNLYQKYQNILALIQKPKAGRYANRDVIKRVSDIIWHSLFWSSHKDRAHLQNLYSYLSYNKLDCFGVALGVVAGCQLLGYKDVHLAISEDHAWVVFGKKRQEAVEVTWHGKGSEDKRGQDVTAGIESKAWLYLSGMPVICNRQMEVASIITAINISITANADCVEVAELQQRLLWLLYDMGYLEKYPMALGNLGELEEVSPTIGRKSCEALYIEAIQSAKVFYNNHHVYPYTYQGTYYYRLGKYREAFRSWANAGDVIRLYTYSCRDDEEIYKEFVDIANEMIPYIIKTESSGHSGRCVLRDSEVFANILRFYDGVCQWEEESSTPILHIGWAKPLVNTISKFDYDIRSQVVINVLDECENPNSEDIKQNLTCTYAIKRNTLQNENKLFEGNNNSITCREKSIIADCKDDAKSEIPTTLADLTAACGEKILNPDFLLQGGGQLFTTDNPKHIGARIDTTQTDDVTTTQNKPKQYDDDYEFMPKNPVIFLHSQKMKGIKDLLLNEKLNTHAISLQVTAHSVVYKKARGAEKSNFNVGCQVSAQSTESYAGTRPKRARRE